MYPVNECAPVTGREWVKAKVPKDRLKWISKAYDDAECQNGRRKKIGSRDEWQFDVCYEAFGNGDPRTVKYSLVDEPYPYGMALTSNDITDKQMLSDVEKIEKRNKLRSN